MVYHLIWVKTKKEENPQKSKEEKKVESLFPIVLNQICHFSFVTSLKFSINVFVEVT